MPQPIDLSRLTRAWLHSREEDTDTTTVYRPADYGFPPSRGRTGFDLRPDGTLLHVAPGPTDRPEGKAGTWRLEGNQLELLPSTPGKPSQTLMIESVDEDRLVTRKRG